MDTLLKDNIPSDKFPLGKTKLSSNVTSPFPGSDEPGPDASLPSDSSQSQHHGGTMACKEKADGKVKAKGSKSSASSQSSDSQDSRRDSLTNQIPKLARAGSKIFDKVKAFEERKHNVDTPKGPSSTRPWMTFGRAASVDSGDDQNKHTGAVKDRGTSDVALKRSFFKQKASSLEEGSSNSSYAQKVQNFQSKFTEELHRIKRLVGRPNLKKAMSTEQLCETDKQSLGKLEPIPPEVIQKLQDRERSIEMKAAESEKQPIPPNVIQKPHNREQRPERMSTEPEKEQLPPQNLVRTQSSQLKGTEEKKHQRDQVPWRTGVSKRQTGKDTLDGKTETDGSAKAKPRIFPAIKLPGQCSPRLPRKSPTRESPTAISPQPFKEMPPNQETEQPVPKKERKSTSPHLQRASIPTKDVPAQHPVKPPRLASSVPAPVPTLQRATQDKPTRGPPAGLKLTIPTIVVEDEPMEEEDEGDEEERIEHGQRRTRKPGRKGRSPRSRGKTHHDRPTSPEQGETTYLQ